MKSHHHRFAAAAAFLAVVLASGPAHALISFGPPAPLNATAATDSADPMDDDIDTDVALASDGTGTWVAAWVSDNPLGGSIGPDLDIVAARSTDDGRTWSAVFAPMSDSATDGLVPDNTPAVAGAAGTFVIAFSSSNTLGGTVGADSDILFTRSTDAGLNWTSAALLNSLGAGDGGFDLDVHIRLATDGSGNWLAVWQRQTIGGMGPTGYQAYYSYSIDDGASWAPQIALGALQSLGLGNGQGTAVAFTGSSFVVAWGSSENLAGNGNDGDILTSVISIPGFVASPPALLNDHATSDGPTETDQYPSLSAIGSTVVATWHSNANVAGAGTDNDVFYSRSIDGGATWSPAAPLNSNAATDTGEDRRVAIANDGTSFLAAWDSTDPLVKLVKTDADILFSRSDDGGQTWSAPAPLATNAFKDKAVDEKVAIAANAATGTWNAAWQSNDTLGKTIGADTDILTVHSEPDCPAMPVAAGSCFESTVSGASLMLVKEAGDKDSFLWKFVKGAAVDYAMDLGDPVATDDYVLCLYDRSAGIPELLLELDIEAGGTCAGKPCWADKGTGYQYKHKAGLVGGVSLVAGAAGLSKALVKAKGAFRAPGLPLDADPSVSVRLHNLGNGRCFATDFSSPSTNDARFFKSKAD